MDSERRHNSTNRAQTVRFCRTSKRLLYPDGDTYPLRNQSLAVLRILAESPNEVISKSTLIAKIWPDVSVTDDSLIQCISEIRKALGDHERIILKTFHRQGYSLSSDVFSQNHIGDYTTAPGSDLISPTSKSIADIHRITTHAAGYRNRKLRDSVLVLLFALITLFMGRFLSPDTQANSAKDTIKLKSVNNHAASTGIQLQEQAFIERNKGNSTNSVRNRDYAKNGMPYWNNRFLWDGYYTDANQ